MQRQRIFLISGLLVGVVVLGLAALGRLRPTATAPIDFDGERARAHVVAQVNFGPRITGTDASRAVGEYMVTTLQAAGWAVETQPFIYRDTPAQNFIARANVGQGPIVILGAHYDSRRQADQDPLSPTLPTPGANDGASGVAVLLELARSLDLDQCPYEIWLAFFDAEDNGGLDGWDWIAGSTYMAQHLTVTPQAMILLDMVGDADQQFYFDYNSDRALSEQVWAVAATLGYEAQFIPSAKYTMLDDHLPFAQRGIRAIDIIDFDYPSWHTLADTPDKVSALSLERVGSTVETLLETHPPLLP